MRNCVFAPFVALTAAKQASVFKRVWAANMRERFQRGVPFAKQMHKNCGEGLFRKDYAQSRNGQRSAEESAKPSAARTRKVLDLARNLRDTGRQLAIA